MYIHTHTYLLSGENKLLKDIKVNCDGPVGRKQLVECFRLVVHTPGDLQYISHALFQPDPVPMPVPVVARSSPIAHAQAAVRTVRSVLLK